MPTALKRILSEPLLHFLLLGGALFALHALLNPAAEPDHRAIVVPAERIEQMAAAFEDVWQRPPTAEELAGLVSGYVDQEVMVREALALNLDDQDEVIRRRLEAKILFLADEAAPEPTEAELRAYFAENPEKFREDPRFSFRQVFLSADRGDRLEEDARRIRAGLDAAGRDVDESTLGDKPIGPPTVVSEPWRTLALQFGEDFADRLAALPLGEWSGPIPSIRGLHFILMTERVDEVLPPFEDMRPRIRHAFLAEQRTRATRDYIDSLRARYDITVEWPQDAAPGAASGFTAEAPAP